MLYELIGIVRPGNIAEVRDIVLTMGQMILRRGGVIRDVANWGVFSLPRPISHAQMRHTQGHYFVMRYDAGASTQQAVKAAMDLDPKVIRSASVRLGDGKLEGLSALSRVPWPVQPPRSLHTPYEEAARMP